MKYLFRVVLRFVRKVEIFLGRDINNNENLNEAFTDFSQGIQKFI